MKKTFNFVASNKRVAAFRKTLVNPLVEAERHAETNGFSLFRPFQWTASPRQGQKCRYRKIAAKLHASPVKSLEIGLYDLLPANEPKLYYTDTSFDTIGQGKSIPLGVGGRFALPDQLPSLSYSLQLN